MPEWSNGAVSKTVNPFRGSRVRIPVFPQQEERCPDVASFFLFRIGPADLKPQFAIDLQVAFVA